MIIEVSPWYVRLFEWLSRNWLNVIKIILTIGVGVGVGYTVFQYIAVAQRPEVQQTMATTVQLVNAMMPLMMYSMMFQLMMTFTSMIREMVPKAKERE
jgi:F0F1-type ATP synthase membrane subunit c/vacuolar-type H+-ATPase subunit K